MKKILIVVPSFDNGGTISSLKNILPVLKFDDIVIDVFPITNKGSNFDYISKYATILGERVDVATKKEGEKVNIQGVIYSTLFHAVKWVKKKLCEIGIDISELAFRQSIRKIKNNNYQLVIAFQEGQPTRYVSLFGSVKKIAWVRCDYSNMLKISNGSPQHLLYSKIDQIVCVSEYTKEVFTKLLPETKNKTIALHNLIDTERIKNGAVKEEQLDERFSFDGFRIVSLGRIDPVKQFSIIPKIAKQLRDKGCQFKWFILGGKADENEYCLLLKNIQKFKVEDCVVLLGEKNNPYPYIDQANLMACTSLSEACPNVINEAKILHTPVVTTDFGSSTEFITNGIEGFIEPIDSIANKIELMINDKKIYDQIKNNLMGFEYNNDQIIKRIEQLICQ